jgi:hypothetical protein
MLPAFSRSLIQYISVRSELASSKPESLLPSSGLALLP